MEQNNQQEISWNEQLYNIVHDVLRRWHAICLFGVIVAIAADMFLTFTYEPVYRTEVSIVRKQTYTEAKDEGEQEEIAEALGYILSSNVFLGQVKKELEIKKLNGSYSTEVVPGTNIMKIIAEADSPQVSYRMLYSMMARYEEIVSLVLGDTELRILDNMHVQLEPSNQLNHIRNLVIFGGVGMLFMIAVYAMFSWMKNTIKEKKDVKNKLQIRLLANIVKEPKLVFRRGWLRKKKALLITQITTSSEFVEAFKRLRIRFEAQTRKKDYKIVCISSTMENEGKSSIIVNLAIALAQQDKKVLLMDLDLGKPALHRLLDIKPEHGVEEVLRGKLPMEDAVYRYERYHIDCIFTKKPVGKRMALLENEGLKTWLSEQRENYDYILIDTPPAYMMSDSKIVAQYADAVLMVVCQNSVPTVLINRTIDHYLMQDTPVMGCVLNRTMPVRISGRKLYRGKGGVEHAES